MYEIVFTFTMYETDLQGVFVCYCAVEIFALKHSDQGCHFKEVGATMPMPC